MLCLRLPIGATWLVALKNITRSESGEAIDLAGATITCTLSTLPTELVVSTSTSGITTYTDGERTDGIRIHAQFEANDTAGVTFQRTAIAGEFVIVTADAETVIEQFQFRLKP